MKKMFHSIGTPVGTVEMIHRWKQTITVTAMAVGQPPVVSAREMGIPNSTTAPAWAIVAARWEGRRSLG
jgi:hypothetical protein